jgi:multidrug efflux pump subunit AcrA (membrane-fusion protein)
MKRFTSILLNFLLPALLLGGSVYTFLLLGKQPPRKPPKPPSSKATIVSVVQPVEHTGGISIKATGVAVPFRELQIASQVSGRIVFKADGLQEGRYVDAGDTLFKIDRRDFEITIEQLQQQIKQSAAMVKALEVELSNTERLVQLANETVELEQREVARIQRLLATKAGTEADLDRVKRGELESREKLTDLENTARNTVAQLVTLKQTSELNKLQLKQAELDLERTDIKAPFAGVVIAVSAEADSVVSAGTALAVIEDTSAVEVLCSLRNQDADIVLSQQLGDDQTETSESAYALPPLEATIRYERGGRTFTWQGVLDRQDGLGLDEKTRTLPCRIVVDAPRQSDVIPSGDNSRPLALVRGMFVSVELQAAAPTPMLSVDETAVRPGKRLWLMRDGKLHMAQIQIVCTQNGKALIDRSRGGLSADDKVIVSPVPNAREGIPVMLKGAEKKKKPGAKKQLSNSATDKNATVGTQWGVVGRTEQTRANAGTANVGGEQLSVTESRFAKTWFVLFRHIRRPWSGLLTAVGRLSLRERACRLVLSRSERRPSRVLA